MLFGNCNEGLGDYCKKWETYCINKEHCCCTDETKCAFCKATCDHDINRCRACSLGKHRKEEE